MARATAASDRNGNLSTYNGSEFYTFDAENRLVAVTTNGLNGNYTYTYDGLGNLVRRAQTNPYVPGYVVKTSYFDGLLEEQSANCTAAYWTKKYYAAFGRVIADRAGATLTYHLADRLGSYVRGIDATGALGAQRASIRRTGTAGRRPATTSATPASSRSRRHRWGCTTTRRGSIRRCWGRSSAQTASRRMG